MSCILGVHFVKIDVYLIIMYYINNIVSVRADALGASLTLVACLFFGLKITACPPKERTIYIVQYIYVHHYVYSNPIYI